MAATRSSRGNTEVVRRALARLSEGRLDGPLVLSDDWRSNVWQDAAQATRELRALQRDIRRLLADANAEGLAFGIDDGIALGRTAVALRRDANGDTVAHVVRGTLRDRVILATLLLLGSSRDVPRRCASCGVFFLRGGRRRYCSRACTNKATWSAVTADRKRLERYRRKQYDAHGWTRGTRLRTVSGD